MRNSAWDDRCSPIPPNKFLGGTDFPISFTGGTNSSVTKEKIKAKSINLTSSYSSPMNVSLLISDDYVIETASLNLPKSNTMSSTDLATTESKIYSKPAQPPPVIPSRI